MHFPAEATETRSGHSSQHMPCHCGIAAKEIEADACTKTAMLAEAIPRTSACPGGIIPRNKFIEKHQDHRHGDQLTQSSAYMHEHLLSVSLDRQMYVATGMQLSKTLLCI